MDKVFSKQTNRLFTIYCISGVAHITLLILLSLRALPGFFMQILFLIEGVMKNHSGISSIVLNESFIWATISGLLSMILLVIALKGTFASVKQIILSQRFVSLLKNKTKGDVVTIYSNDTSVFTAGMLNPKVYISSKLKEFLSPEQIKAVLFHEFSHCKDLDPLRGFIVQLINKILPPFPFKKKLQDIYFTTVELKCDEHSENILGKKRPIIEALYSIMSNDYTVSTQPNIAYFSNLPERIPVLVGTKKFNFKLVTAFSSLFLLAIISLPVVVYTIDFYNCVHIEDCIQTFVNNLRNNSSESLCSIHSMEASDACSPN